MKQLIAFMYAKNQRDWHKSKRVRARQSNYDLITLYNERIHQNQALKTRFCMKNDVKAFTTKTLFSLILVIKNICWNIAVGNLEMPCNFLNWNEVN